MASHEPVTKADLQDVVLQIQHLQDVVLQFQQATKTQFAESEERTRAQIAASEERTRAQIEASEQRTKAQFESVIVLIQQMTDRFDHRLEEFEGRFEPRFRAVESRLDRSNESIVYAMGQLTAFSRWADRSDRDQSSVLGTQVAQQKAIDDLNLRVTRLEQRNQN